MDQVLIVVVAVMAAVSWWFSGFAWGMRYREWLYWKERQDGANQGPPATEAVYSVDHGLNQSPGGPPAAEDGDPVGEWKGREWR